MNSGVYFIRHVPTGRVYVGSSVNLKRRFHWHKTALRSGKHNSKPLQNAWNKHGSLEFIFEIVQYIKASKEDKEELLAAEQFWIDEFKSHLYEHGFNILSKTALIYQAKHKDASRQLQRDNMLNWWSRFTAEERRSIALGKTTADQRSERARIASNARWAKMTDEQKTAFSHKISAGRWKKALTPDRS